MTKWHFLKKVLFFEFGALLFFILLIFFISFFYEIRARLENKKKKVIQDILMHFLAEEIYAVDALIPKCLRSFPLFVSVIEQLDIKMESLSWRFIKEWIIHEMFQEELKRFLDSKFWLKNHIALRALNLSPRASFLPQVKPFLDNKKPIIRFSVIPVLIQIETKEAIHSLLEGMDKEQKVTQYPFRDALLKGSSFVYKTLKNLYQNSEEEGIRLCCLKVLSTRVGFLNYKILEKDLNSSDLEKKWWAIRALANSPSSDMIPFLKKQIEDKDWKIRSLSWQILGKTKLHEELIFMEKGLEDDHYWVRLCAGWALKSQGEEGKKILEGQPQDKKKSHSVSQYVLKASYAEFEKNLETMSVYL